MSLKNNQSTFATGPTWASSHVYGECLVNHERKLKFIKIPKCASTWADRYIAELGVSIKDTWLGGNFQDPALASYHSLVILRDPIERWVSNLPMAHKLDAIVNHPTQPLILLSDLENFLSDEHLARQTDFISGIDFSQTTFFYCDKYLSKNFRRYMIRAGFGDMLPPPHQNVGPSDADSIRGKSHWMQLFSRPDYQARINEIYQADYALIKSANFYRAEHIRENI